MNDDFTELTCRVAPTDANAALASRKLQDRLTKPPGSLGLLETLGAQLSAIAGTCPPPVPEPVTVAIFAGDHGVVQAGVTAWPSEVTAQMVANFCAGGAAINVLARHAHASVVVVDVGVAEPVPADAQGLVWRNVRKGTANLAEGPAMSPEEATAALNVGASVAQEPIQAGAR
ncbi:MAG: nicotinate-nucleotide--dimethylbenzimidazole phosphoribosyltransferase, partial [Acidimicrobiales bacterium]